MKKILFICLSVVVTLSVNAQENNQPKKSKKIIEENVIEEKKDDKKLVEKSVTIKKKPGSKKEKIVIEVNDDKVIVNGKPIEELNDDEMEVLVENGEHFSHVLPRIKMNRSFGKVRKLGPDMLRELKINTPMNKAFLGVQSKLVEEGAAITEVTKESAADKAGLKEGDVITKVNDKALTKEYNLYKAIGAYEPNQKVKISYKRSGKELTTEAVLEKNNIEENRVIELDREGVFDMPFEGGFPFNEERIIERGDFPFNADRFMMGVKRAKLGLKIQDVEEGDGVKILTVEENSSAQKAGILVNDIIVKVGDKDIKSVDDFRKQTATLKEGESMNITVNRNGKSEVLTLKYPKKIKTVEL